MGLKVREYSILVGPSFVISLNFILGKRPVLQNYDSALADTGHGVRNLCSGIFWNRSAISTSQISRQLHGNY
jgi:hypothetical protein